jgi:hypothetical protein
VQESLTNMGKYAEAKQAEISLHNFDSYITVEVKDNGRGFKVESVGSGSHGLAGMRHRVEAAGGRLTVASNEGSGTRISAVLPKTTLTPLQKGRPHRALTLPAALPVRPACTGFLHVRCAMLSTPGHHTRLASMQPSSRNKTSAPSYRAPPLKLTVAHAGSR